MKTRNRMALLCALTLFTGVLACKKEKTVKPEENPNTSEVIYSDWKALEFNSEIGSGIFDAVIHVPELTQDILDKGEVFVFYQKQSPSETAYYSSLPYSMHGSMSGSPGLDYVTFSCDKGVIRLKSNFSPGQERNGSFKFRYVLITGGGQDIGANPASARSGPDGVFYSGWLAIDSATGSSPVRWGESDWFQSSITAPEITQSVLENGVVVVYAHFKPGGYILEGYYKLNMPSLFQELRVGKIILHSAVSMVADHLPYYAFRYVVIPGGQRAAPISSRVNQNGPGRISE